MKLTYEIKEIFKKFINQYPNEIIDDERCSHVELKFNEKIDQTSFLNCFNRLRKLDYILDEKSLFIAREGISRFNIIIKQEFELLQMNLNHKKYERVLNQTLGTVQEIKQLSPNTAIDIFFENHIEEKVFDIFSMDKSDFSIFENQLTIFQNGIDPFNKAIDCLYEDIAEKSLKQLEQKPVSFKKCSSPTLFYQEKKDECQHTFQEVVTKIRLK